MRVTELLAAYALAGLGCALAVSRRRRATLADRALLVALWPLYLPLLLAPPAPGPRDARAERESAHLLAAVDAVDDPALRALLPARALFERVAEHLRALARRAAEVDDAIARTEPGPPELTAPLAALRARLLAERDELLAVCARLRTQLTVLRLSSPAPAPAEAAALLAELLARLEAVGEALRPGVESAA